MNGFENSPIYEIMPPIPEEAKPYFVVAVVVFIALMYGTVRAERIGVTLPWLARYWWERLRTK